MRLLAVFLLLGIACCCHAQDVQLRTCRNDTSRYRYYRPAHLPANQALPVLLIFDPGGRAEFAVEAFRHLADTFGIVLACPDGARNFQFETNLRVAQQVHADLLLDQPRPTQVYLAGFSGGARTATTAAQLLPGIRGVLAAGATFRNPAAPPAELPYRLAIVVGTRDFNYRECVRQTGRLQQAGQPVRLYVTPTDHQWPDAATQQAVWRWLASNEPAPALPPADPEGAQRAEAEVRLQAELARELRRAAFPHPADTLERPTQQTWLRLKRAAFALQAGAGPDSALAYRVLRGAQAYLEEAVLAPPSAKAYELQLRMLDVWTALDAGGRDPWQYETQLHLAAGQHRTLAKRLRQRLRAKRLTWQQLTAAPVWAQVCQLPEVQKLQAEFGSE